MSRPKGTGGKPLTAEHRAHIAAAMSSSERHAAAHQQRSETQQGRMRPYWLLNPRRSVPEEMRRGAIAAQADLREVICPACESLTLEVILLNAGGQSGIARCSACNKRVDWNTTRKGTEIKHG